MDATIEDLAQLKRDGGYVVATFTRRLEHPPAEIWALLTESARLPQWLAPGAIELRVGGSARLDFQDSGIVIDSVVSACVPERLLAWSGPGEPTRNVCWDLQPAPGGSYLRLMLEIPADEDAGRSCAGWEAHLDMLAAALEGVPIKFPFERFKQARELYRARVAALD